MIIASSFEPFDRERVFYDLETWEAMFGRAVKSSPSTADSLARLLYDMLITMNEGRRGKEKAVNTLKLGVEWLYQYTDAHKLSFEAFLYDLEGLLVGGDFPDVLIKGAIQKAIEHTQDDASQPRKGRQRSR